MTRPRVDQLLVGATPGDAIFGEALFLRDVLRERGYRSEIYAESIAAHISSEARDARTYQPRADDVLFYHYSIGTALTTAVLGWDVRLALIYHNVTPAQYFRGVNPTLEAAAAKGRAELPQLRERTLLALGDSLYNQRELDEAGFRPTGCQPLPALLRADAKPDTNVLRTLRDGRVNVLFVGRVLPHKRQDDLVRFLFYLRQLQPSARLILVGAWNGAEAYVAGLLAMAAGLGLGEHVVLAGHVSDGALLSYYQSADLFVSASEHEGFCVPMVEAMSLGVPIIARASTAIPETLGDAGILIREPRWDVAAAAADTLLRDKTLRTAMHARGLQRALEFRAEVVREIFVAHLASLAL